MRSTLPNRGERRLPAAPLLLGGERRLTDRTSAPPCDAGLALHRALPKQAASIAQTGLGTLAVELESAPGASILPMTEADARAFEARNPGHVIELVGQVRLEPPAAAFGPLRVAAADSFSYTDPVDHAVSRNQGIRVLFDGGSRIVFRLSGTGTQGATLRVYLERFEPADGALDTDTAIMLADLAAAADAIDGIARHTGRTAPDVVT